MIKGYKVLPQDVKKYVPDYEYLLYDLSRYTNEEIKGEVQLRILLTIFRDVFTKDNKAIIETVLRAAEHLGKLENQQTGIEYSETFMKYILNASRKLTKEDVEDIIKKVEASYPEGSEVVMTLAEQFREEGELRAETKTLSKIAIRLLTKKFGKLPEEIKNKISKLDTDVLEIIIDSIFVYEKLDDVKKCL